MPEQQPHSKSRCNTFQQVDDKGTDRTVQMYRLVWAFGVCKPQKTGFLTSRPILFWNRSHDFSVHTTSQGSNLALANLLNASCFSKKVS